MPSSPTLLIVDADVAMRACLTSMVQSIDLEPSFIRSCSLSKKICKEPAVILFAGAASKSRECLQRLRNQEHLSDVPILALCSETPEEIANAFSAGANDVLTLPVRSGELLARIQAQMALKRHHRRDSSNAYRSYESELRISPGSCYAHMVTSSSFGITVVSHSGVLLFANPRAHQITGCNKKQLAGSSLVELFKESEREPARQIVAGFMKDRYPQNVELTLTSGENSDPRVVVGSFAPVTGSEPYVLFSFQDVTEKRQTENELRKARDFLASLIDASLEGIVAADVDDTIVLFNKSAERIYGLSADEVLGKRRFKSLFPKGEAEHVRALLHSEEQGGIGRMGPVRIDIFDRHSQRIPISFSAALIYDEGVELASFGIFTDLREQMVIEERLAQAQEKLALSEKQILIAELAGTAAHELNQPLTSVLAYAELLTRRLSCGSPEHNAAAVVASEANRMSEIIKKIGKITTYETKSYVGEQRILDLEKASE
ncbi:MAG: PAS domain S-box protein [Myxococcota bacterium]